MRLVLEVIFMGAIVALLGYIAFGEIRNPHMSTAEYEQYILPTIESGYDGPVTNK